MEESGSVDIVFLWKLFQVIDDSTLELYFFSGFFVAEIEIRGNVNLLFN